MARPPAPGHIPFCLGLKYQMLIIKLLSGDVLCSSTSDAFEKALSARAGCVGRGRGKAARTLVNRPPRGPLACAAGCFCSALNPELKGRCFTEQGPACSEGKCRVSASPLTQCCHLHSSAQDLLKAMIKGPQLVSCGLRSLMT